MRRTLLLLTSAAVLGCQTYDFEPVSPLAISQTTQTRNVTGRTLKPNMVILVDKSGSMSTPTTGGSTRIADLRAVMGPLLTGSGTVARMGLVFYPPAAGCPVPTSTTVDLPPPTPRDDAATDGVNQANANQINSAIQTVPTSGGTPTAGSLDFCGTIPGLNDRNDNRQDFILLLTDGLPNCNQTNPNTQCVATNSECQCTIGRNACDPGSTNCVLGCLDRGTLAGTPWGVVASIQALRSKEIKTIVVGFGTEAAATTGPAPETLNAMAEVGGFARRCPITAAGTNVPECSGGLCLPGGLCQKKYYQAETAADLTRALRDIWDTIGPDPCEYPLEAQPSNPRFLTVLVNGVAIPSCAPGTSCDTWEYTGGRVYFRGAKCQELQRATQENPFRVEIRIVEQL